MININNEVYTNKSLLGSYWKLAESDERLILSFSQKNNVSPLLAKLLLIRNIDDESVKNYLYPDINHFLPNPFLLKDMEKSVNRVISAIIKKEKIGIIADYDVDGSTSASILFKFLKHFSNKIIIKTPDRLSEGYGPNIRIMDEFKKLKVDLVFTLDCGTTSFDIIDNKKYDKIDLIVIDHHLSEINLPKVFAIINPNRIDETNEFKEFAAVGVTFLFLMAVRKKLRINNFFDTSNKEPNLMSLLDLVALGTVCDVVNLISYNRTFVKKGLELIKERKNISITQIIDNSNIQSTPISSDLGFIIGPQLNAASRINDSSLPLRFLISDNIAEIESISRKLILFNEKRKLIEANIYENALIQARKQENQNFILVYNKDWHNGVLGIIASRLVAQFNKPTFVISFNNSVGVASARSIHSIDIGNIILEAKNKDILLAGGGHKMAAGLKININNIDKFMMFLKEKFKEFPKEIFYKIEIFDSELSVNQINDNLLNIFDLMEPFGAGNPEPKFIIKDISIASVKTIKDKHLLIFFQNDFSINFNAICFNCIGTILGDYLLKFKIHKFTIGCTIKRNNFNNKSVPQIIIKDAMIIN